MGTTVATALIRRACCSPKRPRIVFTGTILESMPRREAFQAAVDPGLGRHRLCPNR